MTPRVLAWNRQTTAVNCRMEDVTGTQQHIPESPKVTPTWNASKYKVRKLHS